MDRWAPVLVGVAAALGTAWLALVATLAAVRPDRASLRASVRLLPDLVRLVGRLARDPSLPRPVRARLWLLLGYLALPVDVVPDFIPVVGYADDAIVVLALLRSVGRRAGPDAIRRHWPGTEEGLEAVLRIARLTGV